MPGVMASASLTASAKGTGDRGSGNEEGVPAVQLLIKRPVALLHLIPKPAVLFAAGAIAGAIGKTLTAPLDRVKLLLQVQGGYSGVQVTAAAKSGDLLQAFAAIGREEGLLAYWKGNIPQVGHKHCMTIPGVAFPMCRLVVMPLRPVMSNPPAACRW